MLGLRPGVRGRVGAETGVRGCVLGLLLTKEHLGPVGDAFHQWVGDNEADAARSQQDAANITTIFTFTRQRFRF